MWARAVALAVALLPLVSGQSSSEFRYAYFFKSTYTVTPFTPECRNAARQLVPSLMIQNGVANGFVGCDGDDEILNTVPSDAKSSMCDYFDYIGFTFTATISDVDLRNATAAELISVSRDVKDAVIGPFQRAVNATVLFFGPDGGDVPPTASVSASDGSVVVSGVLPVGGSVLARTAAAVGAGLNVSVRVTGLTKPGSVTPSASVRFVGPTTMGTMYYSGASSIPLDFNKTISSSESPFVISEDVCDWLQGAPMEDNGQALGCMANFNVNTSTAAPVAGCQITQISFPLFNRTTGVEQYRMDTKVTYMKTNMTTLALQRAAESNATTKERSAVTPTGAEAYVMSMFSPDVAGAVSRMATALGLNASSAVTTPALFLKATAVSTRSALAALFDAPAEDVRQYAGGGDALLLVLPSANAFALAPNASALAGVTGQAVVGQVITFPTATCDAARVNASLAALSGITYAWANLAGGCSATVAASSSETEEKSKLGLYVGLALAAMALVLGCCWVRAKRNTPRASASNQHPEAGIESGEGVSKTGAVMSWRL